MMEREHRSHYDVHTDRPRCAYFCLPPHDLTFSHGIGVPVQPLRPIVHLAWNPALRRSGHLLRVSTTCHCLPLHYHSCEHMHLYALRSTLRPRPKKVFRLYHTSREYEPSGKELGCRVFSTCVLYSSYSSFSKLLKLLW